MKTATDLHHTHEKVMETGSYVCASGEMRHFIQGENFPACPVTGTDTTWRHAYHQHKTGDRVTEAGQYVDADGEHIHLNIGDRFPECPITGKDTRWIHA